MFPYFRYQHSIKRIHHIDFFYVMEIIEEKGMNDVIFCSQARFMNQKKKSGLREMICLHLEPRIIQEFLNDSY